jgi:uncharacterized protein YkwD
MRIALPLAAVLMAGAGLAACAQTSPEETATDLGPPVNAFRAAEGERSLRRNAKADAAASAHARDMARQGFFGHNGSNGSSVGGRLKAAGCRFTGAAENIAKGQRSDAEVVAAWAASPGHRRNMLAAYDQYGAARIGDTWVLVLASGC